MQKKWTSENLYTEGDVYFEDVISNIKEAQHSIDIQTYIFKFDVLGFRILDLLEKAASRGVKIRLHVDGVGSLEWTHKKTKFYKSKGINVHVFNTIEGWALRILKHWLNIFSVLRLYNRRNHRKLILIDKKVAFISSMNISAQHLKSLKGKNSWRDIGVKLTGPSVLDLDLAFESFWSRKKFTLNLVRSPIRINSDLLTRRKNYKDLVRHILNAKKHICIATAYFVPHWSILKAIKWVANKGVTVEIMVTKRSDVSIMPWIARTFYPSLLYAGVKIFEFMPSVLHAKCILVDDWLILGSSNFNHRSVFLDFELDVVLTSEESILKTKLFFQETKELSHEINLENLPQTLSFFQKILSNFILVLRKWL